MYSDAELEHRDEMGHILTFRQELFCQEYLKDLHGTKAATRAGYSAKSARAKASQMLGMGKIQRYLAKLEEKRFKRLELDQDRVLRELILIGFSSIADFAFKNGSLKQAEGADPSVVRAVSRVKFRSRVNARGDKVVDKEYWLWDKMQALKMLGSHLHMFAGLDEFAKMSGEERAERMAKLLETASRRQMADLEGAAPEKPKKKVKQKSRA